MSRLRSTALSVGVVVAALAPLATPHTSHAEPTTTSFESGNRHRHRTPPGEISVKSRHSFEETWANLIGALDSNPNIRIVAIVDHAAAAAASGLELDPNRLVVFGNPNLGTPLMQANQTAGIDLPQKMHVVERRGVVTVSYNSPSYLVDRHRLGDVATIDTIGGALASLAEAATGRAPETHGRHFRWHRHFDGLETTQSDADFDTTWNRLVAAIEASPANVAFTVDHGANAAANGLELRPTRLVVFGNPNLGTPLMQTSPSAGIDLPLKILVWEDADGTVQVTTTNIWFVVGRHRIFGSRATFETIRTIGTALDNFVNAATKS